jgi:glycosyltransferase involved in cell wall biosynthesis
MEVIRSTASDIRWKHLPGLYFHMERFLLEHAASAFVVREDAVEAYRQRYPEIADRFRFTPTWMDPEVFYPVPPDQRAQIRAELLQPFGVRDSDRVLISVGRLDRQKDPLLLCAAFAALCRTRPDLRLVLIGDGVLRSEAEASLRALGVSDRVLLAGLQPAAEVARYLNAADLFVLTSAYEGMPMSVLEALGVGLPVCSTDVGEVRRAVTSGVNGQLVHDRTPEAIARALTVCLEHLDRYRGAPALEAARVFVPERILAPFYANYRRLARRPARAVTPPTP